MKIRIFIMTLVMIMLLSFPAAAKTVPIEGKICALETKIEKLEWVDVPRVQRPLRQAQKCLRKARKKIAVKSIRRARKHYGDAVRLYRKAKSRKSAALNNQTKNWHWSGGKLTKVKGVNYGPSGKETWYCEDMSWEVSYMRYLGFSAKKYPYWIRKDGCRMLGDYIMCAANLSVHAKGQIVDSSLGKCIVVDTGGFAYGNPYQLDIAVTW